MNTGASADSPSASRNLLMAAFRLWSKSTKVSAGQSFAAQILTRDDFSRVLQQGRQNLEWLLLQLDLHSSTAQFACLEINFKHPEANDARRAFTWHSIAPVAKV
jgi:hypothetical protein